MGLKDLHRWDATYRKAVAPGTGPKISKTTKNRDVTFVRPVHGGMIIVSYSLTVLRDPISSPR